MKTLGPGGEEWTRGWTGVWRRERRWQPWVRLVLGGNTMNIWTIEYIGGLMVNELRTSLSLGPNKHLGIGKGRERAHPGRWV